MSFRRVAQLAAVVLASLVCLSCGQVYRPVVIPTTTVPPSPSNFHTVFGISTSTSFNPNVNGQGVWSNFPGAAMEIDVSGDTILGETGPNSGTLDMVANPTHAVALPNFSRIFVANAGSVAFNTATNQPEPDIVYAFVPAADSTVSTGFGTANIFSLPTSGPPGSLAGNYPNLPDFVATTQSNTIYVANYGTETSTVNGIVSTDSIAVLNTAQNTISRIVYLSPGAHPVAMAVTPNGSKLYVANQGNNTVSSFNTVDMSTNTLTGFTGTLPVWVVARGDNQKVYVLTQGDGQLVTIDTATDAVTGNLPVGAGANFILYDAHLQRLYVTSPATSTLFVFATSFTDSQGVLHDALQQLAAIPISGSVGCAGCTNSRPVSVAALPDGSRVYVASFQLSSTCTESDPANTGTCQVIPLVTVVDAASFAVKTTLTPLTSAQSSAVPPSVPELGACIASTPYNPGVISLGAVPSVQSVRFRLSATAAADSSHVYVSICDAGSVADIITTPSSVSTGGNNVPDVLVTDLPTPFGVCTNTPTCSTQPPLQTPIWLFPGQ